jgi:hypothetical protein
MKLKKPATKKKNAWGMLCKNDKVVAPLFSSSYLPICFSIVDHAQDAERLDLDNASRGQHMTSCSFSPTQTFNEFACRQKKLTKQGCQSQASL